MHEDDDAKLLRLGPRRVEPGRGQILAFHVTADGGAAQAQ
jgi:hypothetical protein